MSNSSDTIGCVPALIICVVLVIAALCGGVQVTNFAWQESLVKSNHAEYYLDENNERQWRMKGYVQ